MVSRLIRRNRELEDEVHALRKTLFLHTGRPYPAPGMYHAQTPDLTNSETSETQLIIDGSGFDVEGLPPTGHSGDYNVPHSFGSPYLTSANPYDQWPSSVVPVPSTVTVNSVESSPGASGHGDEFTPTYVHAGVPAIDGAVIAGSTSAPSLDSAKTEYQEVDTGMDSAVHKDPPPLPRGLLFADWGRFPPGSSSNTYPNHNAQHPSTYLHEPPWVYPAGAYYTN